MHAENLVRLGRQPMRCNVLWECGAVSSWMAVQCPVGMRCSVLWECGAVSSWIAVQCPVGTVQFGWKNFVRKLYLLVLICNF